LGFPKKKSRKRGGVQGKKSPKNALLRLKKTGDPPWVHDAKKWKKRKKKKKKKLTRTLENGPAPLTLRGVLWGGDHGKPKVGVGKGAGQIAYRTHKQRKGQQKKQTFSDTPHHKKKTKHKKDITGQKKNKGQKIKQKTQTNTSA